MGHQQSTAERAVSPASEPHMHVPADTKMAIATAGEETVISKEMTDSKRPAKEGASAKEGGGESKHDHAHDHSHGHSHDHSTGDGCGCGHAHGCNCALATKNIIKSFLPLLSEERKAELDGWTLNEDTWSCVPRTDAPSFATMEAVYAYKLNKPANEAPAVNAYMSVLNTLNHHIKAFGSTFFHTVRQDTSKYLDENTARCIFPTQRYGAWLGVMVDVDQKLAVIYDPAATLSETDREELEAKVAPFKATKIFVMTPKNSIPMRYSALVVCTGLEVLVRAGWAGIAPRVFGKLAEIIAEGGDLEAVLESITEESMHAGEEDFNGSTDAKVDNNGGSLSAKLVNLAIDPAANKIAAKYADRIAWSLATGKPSAPKWSCRCASQDEKQDDDAALGDKSQDPDTSHEADSDKENVPPAAEDDSEVDESPAPKKRKEDVADEA